MGCGASTSIEIGDEPSLDKKLLEAAKSGDMDACLELVAFGDPGDPRLDLQDPDGNTVLHYWCSTQSIEPALISFCEPLPREHFCIKNKKGLSPFLCAAQAGNHAILEKFFLKDSRLLIEQLDGDGNTALHLAVLNGHKESVAVLLQNDSYELLKSLHDFQNNKGETPDAIARSQSEAQPMNRTLFDIAVLFSGGDVFREFSLTKFFPQVVEGGRSIHSGLLRLLVDPVGNQS